MAHPGDGAWRIRTDSPGSVQPQDIPDKLARRAEANLISVDAYATLYWNNSLTRLWQEARCRSRFSEPAVSARH